MDNHAYFLLNLLFGVASMATLLLAIVFVNYEVVSRAALVASVLLPTGALGMLVWDPLTGRVPRRARVKLCIYLSVSLAFLAFASVYPAATLLVECPHLDREHAPASGRLWVPVRYTLLDEETGRESQRLLLLEYDIGHKRIVRRELRHGAEEEEEEESWLEVEKRTLAEEEVAVCSEEPASLFFFLEREIRRGLRERRREAHQRPATRVSPHRSAEQGQVALQMDREALNKREICLYEFGFSLGYLLFIASVFTMVLLTLLWFTFWVADAVPLPLTVAGESGE